MERIAAKEENTFGTVNTISFNLAVADFEREMEKTETVSCNQLLKNLLKTNFKLLKLNELGSLILL